MQDQPAASLPPTRNALRARFSEVVHAYQRPLRAFLQRYTNEASAAADLAQESFVKAYFSLDRFVEGRDFAAWLFTIAANHARDFVRRKRREPWVEADSPPEPLAADNPPDAALQENETRAALDRALARLPLTLREPVLLHYQLDWPIQQIAEYLGIEEGAVRTRLHRARARLQELMNPNGAAS